MSNSYLRVKLKMPGTYSIYGRDIEILSSTTKCDISPASKVLLHIIINRIRHILDSQVLRSRLVLTKTQARACKPKKS